MVNSCAVVGCSNRGNKDKDKSYYHFDNNSKNLGPEAQSLSLRRQREWLSAIKKFEISTESILPLTMVLM